MYQEQLSKLKAFYETGSTRPYAFRKQQLLALKQAVISHEQDIMQALHTDLKKSLEESYATEIGLILSEINFFLRHLKGWMQPEDVPTDLVNLPSSSRIYKDPLGVVLIIAPWNYPFQLLFNPLIAAIAGGNCAVLKPSESSVATATIMGKICRETFAENHVLFVNGYGPTVVPSMMQGFVFNHVFYTGSIPVGKVIYRMAAENLVPVTLELGGKSPAIVEETANLKVAAQRIVLGKFVNAGQTCIAPDYILVHESIKQALIAQLSKAIEQFYTTDASQSHDYGRIIDEKHFNRLVNYLNEGRILYGGDCNKEELFIAPTLLEDVSLESPIMQEEIFGPLLPIISYKTKEDALNIVKQNDNPLAFYLFTTNKPSEKFWLENVAFGGGCINNADWHFTNHHLPFGGVGNSGIGAYHGKFGFDLFTRKKALLKTPNWFNPSIKYPSFKGKLKLFKWMFR